MSANSLLNKDFIKSHLTAADPWCRTHGSDNGSEDLGAGMLYYGLTYSLKARTCVCLGSGGGFVPRLMRQAQRDLNIEGSRTFLVDGTKQISSEKKAIWGTPCWVSKDSLMRTNYPDIDIMLELTATAFRRYFQPHEVKIDYLHIDADHHYEGVKLDWDLYSSIVADEGVITLHDTVNYREPCGVYVLMEEIRQQGIYEMINFPIKYGTAILRKRQAAAKAGPS